MKGSLTTPRTRLRLIAAALLVLGLGSALAIYLTAESAPGNPLGYEPEDTKRYVRDMELYGGKVNLLASELRLWFTGLWHGRRLAFTVACTTVLVALAIWCFAGALPSDRDAAAMGGNGRGGTGS